MTVQNDIKNHIPNNLCVLIKLYPDLKMTIGVYSGLIILLGIIGRVVAGKATPDLMLGMGISIALAAVYFWLLDINNRSIIYWPIMIGGLFGLVYYG